jgi:hypothetical protein
LLKARATKDVREARVSVAGKRIALQADLIQYDLGEPLRMKLRHLAHDLLITKENEMVALFNTLFPPPTNVSVEQLVHNCAPIVHYRQIANWTDIALEKDPQAQLSQLRELPGRWLTALKSLLEESSQ